MVIPAIKARIIYADLQKIPPLTREVKHLRGANKAYATNDAALRRELAQKDTVIAATQRRVTTEKVLRKDADNRAVRWEGKAKKRFWTIVGETALLVLITVAAVR